ncbi:MAG TPA: hypothetical protein VFR86_16750 [Burkholderiaceae bacterium]|nr:hypothetical protein [Burkholderiaceae bacterium]
MPELHGVGELQPQAPAQRVGLAGTLEHFFRVRFLAVAMQLGAGFDQAHRRGKQVLAGASSSEPPCGSMPRSRDGMRANDYATAAISA